ncbi:hypothetical protein, partial [Streptomyces alanosinicus]|uniref:hypothetical protein n=1 Tax=Streptomyces alanosinicus TaxID=68171 RepID=UPI001E437EFA
HESGARGGMILPHTASSLCFQRNLDHRNAPTDGVSTNLALIFGTLLSSQGTVASFVLTLSGFPPGASLRCFKLYQGFSVSPTTLCEHAEADPEIGSDEFGFCWVRSLSHPFALSRSTTVHGALKAVQIRAAGGLDHYLVASKRNRYFI